MEETHGKGKAKAKEPTVYLRSLELLMCHHCSELFEEHVYRCENKHLMCQRCHDNQKGMCGKCDGAIGTKRDGSLEDLFADFLVSCRYQKDGCNQTCTLTLAEKRKHEYGCSYGPTPKEEPLNE